MNIHIITSSYPASPEDPSGTAGLFVRQFALELAARHHNVIVQPAARKNEYIPDPGISIVPAPWKGGDQELASMNKGNPGNWWIFLFYFLNGIKNTLNIDKEYGIDRTLCMWAVPSGIFGLAGKLAHNIPYDVWALGSDIWKIRRIPILGKMILKTVIKNADRVFADGIYLCKEVKELTGVTCEFLASSRKLPPPQNKAVSLISPGLKHFIFVGRYHINKGPDLLIKAVSRLPLETREAIHIHMFGLGPMETELKDMISELSLHKYISLNGPIQSQEFSNYLESVSFLVIPSRVESIPVVFSDAVQTGTPVISTPVGDLKDLITKFNCGIIAAEVTAEALSSSIEEAVATGKDHFKEGVTNACKHFEIGNSAERWLNINSH